MLGEWIFTPGKFCQRAFTQRRFMIHTYQSWKRTYTDRHTHWNKGKFEEHHILLEAAYCRHGALCVFISVFSGCTWVGRNSFLKARARHPAVSPIGLLLFLFCCCFNIAFTGSLTWEQSAWIYCSSNAIFPRKGDLHSRCGESVIVSLQSPPPPTTYCAAYLQPFS